MIDRYVYKVSEVLRVVDGDTIDCRISLGFGLTAAFRFRLAHVDAPERFGLFANNPRGKQATEFTRHWLNEREGFIYVRSLQSSTATVGIGDGAFGRWLGVFFTAEGETLHDALIEAGLG